jgi:hypothetical protein
MKGTARRAPAFLLALGGALMLAGAPSASGQVAAATSPPTVTVTLAPGRHTVGDRVEATLAVTVPAGRLRGEPRFPLWPAEGGAAGAGVWGQAEVVEAGPVERAEQGGAVTFRQRLMLVAFAPGALPLPPLSVALPFADATVEARTPADLALTVDSMLPPSTAPEADAAKLEPKPPEPPRPLPWGAKFWWTAGLLAAACLAAGVLAFRRRRLPAGAEAATHQPPVDPFRELSDGVAEALGAPSPAAGHTLLSRAVRRYLGRTFGFPAPESSTSEIQRALAGRPLPPGALPRLTELLRGCDLVKFARLAAPPAALATRAEGALAVASEVERRRAPAAGGEAA